MFRVVFVDVLLVSLVQVLAEHHITVFAHRLQARLLRDGGDVRRAYFVGPVYVVLQVHFLKAQHISKAYQRMLLIVQHDRPKQKR